MHFYEYKGFTIYPNPRLSLESDTWAIHLSIRRGDRIASYSAEHSFSTKGEAVFHTISFAKKIIDGEIEDYSVDDML